MSGKLGRRSAYVVMQYDATDYIVTCYAQIAFADRAMAEACADKRNERNSMAAESGDLFADDIWYGVEEVSLVGEIS